MGKIIIFSAPSGSGKSTILQYLMMQPELKLRFSVSATSRAPRGAEEDGKEYHFLSVEEFEKRIAADEFLEYEEVYAGCFYGTLKSEVDKILNEGYNVAFDVDVVGGLNIKEYFGEKALAVFIQPPTVEILRSRLENRKTDSAEMIEKRLAKATWEMSFQPRFDTSVIADVVEVAQKDAFSVIKAFLEK